MNSNYNNIISNIINLQIIQTKTYLLENYDKIINLSIDNVSDIMVCYIDRINHDITIKTNNYKKINTFEYYDIIYKFLPYVNNNIQNKIIINISKCMYGLKILNKIPNVNNYILNNINDIINTCASSWTFPVFLYYLDLIKEIQISYLDDFIADCFLNSDDRIYKFVIDNNNNLKLINYNEKLINKIILNIFLLNSNIKYTLRRLKYLNSLFPNLGEKHFNIIIDRFNGDLNAFDKIIKYYYNQPFTSSNINKLMDCIYYSSNINEKINYYYSLLKTTTEKNKFIISSLFINGTANKISIIDGKNDFNNLSDFIKAHLDNILFEHNTVSYFKFNISEFKDFINNIGFSNVSSCLIINESFYVQKSGIFFLLPLLVAHGYNGLFFNKTRYYINRFIKNIRLKKQIIHKLKLYPIINELKSLNNKSIVFNKLRNNKKQLFNTIPPYHLYPGQLNSINNGCLLKEKADGILVYNIPNDVNPIFPFKNKLKAEFIEDLDLYLVFDIDEEKSIEDRHLLIHNKHKYGQTSIPIINNEDDMIYNINMERDKLKSFLKEPYNNYRWYPKPAWKIVNIDNFIVPFIDIINMKPISNWIINNDNDNYNNDGLILTPLNGDREIKIKPKNLYTIDLLYLDNKWLDRDGYEWDIIIKNDVAIEDYNNTIWRCYPNDNKFEAKEIRYDKTKPNTHDIVSTIIDLYKMDYKHEYPRIYNINYNHNNSNWKNIIDDNNKILKMMLNKISNLINIINVLDCGCGSGRTIKYINKFDKYFGIDIDYNMLGSGINNYNINTNINFMYCDLNKEWPKIISNKKFNLVICLSSIMHFMTDTFWANLNSVTDKSTKMLINIVDVPNNFIYQFNENEYFIERKEQRIIYKFPIHNSIMEENYVDINIINKYGWNIIETFKPDYNNLTKYYRWYILCRN